MPFLESANNVRKQLTGLPWLPAVAVEITKQPDIAATNTKIEYTITIDPYKEEQFGKSNHLIVFPG